MKLRHENTRMRCERTKLRQECSKIRHTRKIHQYKYGYVRIMIHIESKRDSFNSSHTHNGKESKTILFLV